MATYRAYFLDSDNHIKNRREFEADSEAEAIQTAQQWLDGRLIEVWCGPIMIDTIKPIHKRR